MKLSATAIKGIRDHAEACFPAESCGVVIVRHGRTKYIPCKNISGITTQFAIDPEDYANAEDQGEVIYIVHSHPNLPPHPSEADRVGCETSGVPWIIVNWPTGIMKEFAPCGYKAPLVGRSWAHGILDCWTLMRDYFRETYDYALPDYARADKWWETGADLYRQYLPDVPHEVVELRDIRPGDVVLMHIASPVINHAAVYVGDGMILHHPMKLLSTRDMYGGYFQKMTAMIVRLKGINHA